MTEGDSHQQAIEYRMKGNDLFNMGQHEKVCERFCARIWLEMCACIQCVLSLRLPCEPQAAEMYTKGIELDDKEAKLYSNRSICFGQMGVRVSFFVLLKKNLLFHGGAHKICRSPLFPDGFCPVVHLPEIRRGISLINTFCFECVSEIWGSSEGRQQFCQVRPEIPQGTVMLAWSCISVCPVHPTYIYCTSLSPIFASFLTRFVEVFAHLCGLHLLWPTDFAF